MSGKDLGSDRYQFSVDRGKAEALARRMKIPLWQAEMALADQNMMRDIVSDARRSNPVTTSPSLFPPDYSQAGQGTPTQSGTGWRMSQPLGNPPGISLIDKMYPTTSELEAEAKAKAKAKEEPKG